MLGAVQGQRVMRLAKLGLGHGFLQRRQVGLAHQSSDELALAPSFRDDFRESLFRTITALTGLGVTVLMTVDIVQSFMEFGLSPHITEFLADVLVLQRYFFLQPVIAGLGLVEFALAIGMLRTTAPASGPPR